MTNIDLKQCMTCGVMGGMFMTCGDCQNETLYCGLCLEKHFERTHKFDFFRTCENCGRVRVDEHICPKRINEDNPDSSFENHKTLREMHEQHLRETYPQNHVFESGAQRSHDADNVRFDLICPTALTRLAQTYDEGAKKYGDTNYCKGMPISSTLNHSLRHIFLYLQGDVSEDHLAHAAWGLFTVMHYEDLCMHHKNGTEIQKIRDLKYLERR